MANGGDIAPINGNMTLGARAMSMATISTVFTMCAMLSALGIVNGTKEDDIFNVGVPNTAAILSGVELSPIKQKEILESDGYAPFIRPNIQPDLKAMTLRDTNPKMATGSGATLTLTQSSGVITAVGITASASDFAGTAPGVRVDDPAGSGQGAIIRAIVTNSSVSAFTIVSGGYGYSTNSTVTLLVNLSAGEKYDRPYFRWSENRSESLVYQHDIDRATALAAQQGGSAEVFDAAINDIVMDEQKEKIGVHINRMAEDLIFGTPTVGLTGTGDLWDQPYGVLAAIHNSNTYAGVDRTLAANAYWCAKYDTTAHTFSLIQMWNDMNLTKGLINNGGVVDVIFVSATLFSKWKSEAEAYMINVNTDPMVQKLTATFGFKIPVLKYMNTYVILESRLPPKTVVGMNLKPWIIAFKGGKKWTPTKLYPQEAVEGGKDASLFYTKTQYMFMCTAPQFGAVQYTAVS